MTTQEQLEARIREIDLLTRIGQCERRIARICSEHRGPKMSIPAQWDDDDFFICTTLRDLKHYMNSTTPRQYTVIRTDIDSMGFPYTVEAPGYLAADVDALLRERDDELVKLKDKAMKYNLDQLGI